MIDSQKKKKELMELQLDNDIELSPRLQGQLIGGAELSSSLRVVCESLYAVFRSLSQKKPGIKHAFAIAGSQPGEGATMISLLSTVALCMDPVNSVLLVDGNLMQPELHTYFGTEQKGGLVEFVEQELKLQDVLHKDKLSHFHFLPAGRPVSSPSVFFGSDQLSNALAELKKIFNFIIFDCAPVLKAPETSILASHLTGLIMVVQSESTRREEVSSAKQQLVDANANIAGVILNKQKHYIPEFLYRRL